MENNILKNLVPNINLSKYYIILVFNRPKSPYWVNIRSFLQLYFDTEKIENNLVVFIKNKEDDIKNLKILHLKYNLLNWNCCSIFIERQLIHNENWKFCFLEHLLNNNYNCFYKIQDITFPCKEIAKQISYLNNKKTVLDVINKPYYEEHFCPFFKEKEIDYEDDITIKSINSDKVINIQTVVNTNYFFSIYFENPQHKN